MKKFVKIVLSLILVLGMVVAPLQGVETVCAEEAETNPMRAMWVRPKEWTKEQVEEKVQSLADVGINTIFLETVYEGFTIFPVEYDPIYQNPMYQEFDVLQAYIDACHSRGMQLHAWVESFFIGLQTNRGGGPVYKAYKGTGLLLADTEGNEWEETMYGKMYFLNPARPECREWIVGLYEIIIENYDVDGLQLDYVRYPVKTGSVDYGYDEYTINAFKEEKGYDPRDYKENSFERDVFDQFKRNQVTEYVKMCSTRLRAINPDLIISLSVVPDFYSGVQDHMQSAELWMDEGYGDLIVPMSYAENQTGRTNSAIKAANDSPRNVVMGVSAQNGFSLESVENQTKTVLGLGTGVSFFEYEYFFSAGYADYLKDTVLKDTQFNIDVDTYKTDVVRDDTTENEEDNEKDNPLLGLNLSTTDLIVYAVLAVAVIAIIVEAIILLKGSKKKKGDAE